MPGVPQHSCRDSTTPPAQPWFPVALHADEPALPRRTGPCVSPAPCRHPSPGTTSGSWLTSPTPRHACAQAGPLGTSCSPLDQHALLEAETPLRTSPARGLESGPPPAPGRRESLFCFYFVPRRTELLVIKSGRALPPPPTSVFSLRLPESEIPW